MLLMARSDGLDESLVVLAALGAVLLLTLVSLLAAGWLMRLLGHRMEAMLTRLPRGYAEGHPAERWLRYRSFTAHRPLTEDEVRNPRLPALLERDFAALVPLVRWLNAAIGYRAWERRY